MAEVNELYAELKPDVTLLAQVLFELSEKFLRDQGNFLPHAAVLTDGGEVKLVRRQLGPVPGDCGQHKMRKGQIDLLGLLDHEFSTDQVQELGCVWK